MLLDEVPPGLLPGRDHATVVTFDEPAIGADAAELLAPSIPREGGIGVLGAATDPLAGSERERAFQAWIRTHRPDVRMSVGRFGDVSSPGGAALRLFAEDPGIAGVYVGDGDAAGEVVRRLVAAGHGPALVSIGLGPEAAVDLAAGGLVRAIVAPQPCDQGESAATAALLALLERPVPARIVVPSLRVTRNTVLEAFLETWHEHPPPELTAARWGRPGR